MTTKAVCVGINKYRDSPLNGCVNDAMDMYEFLTEYAKVPADNVRLLLDDRATCLEILHRLEWLCNGAQSGDHLFFHISGHGTRMRRRHSNTDILGELESCLVPFDYDWNYEATFISDSDLHAVPSFASLPANVDLTFVFDVCHAGGMREIRSSLAGTVFSDAPRKSAVRYLAPPLDIAVRHKNRELQIRQLGASWLQLDSKEQHRILAACQEDQTASDSTFGMDGRPNGAFTWSLLQSLRQGEARTWLQVMESALQLLRNDGFMQVPAIIARTAAINSYPLH